MAEPIPLHIAEESLDVCQCTWCDLYFKEDNFVILDRQNDTCVCDNCIDEFESEADVERRLQKELWENWYE